MNAGRRTAAFLLALLVAAALVLLDGAPTQAQGSLPRVRLVATGGTIANRSGTRLSPGELVRLAPQARSPESHCRAGVGG